MGLWEVTEEVLSQTAHAQNEESMPSYAHISYCALKDIPKEYTNPYNCKVRALAFNNNHKVRFIPVQKQSICNILFMFSLPYAGIPFRLLGSPHIANKPSSVVRHITLLSASFRYFQELGAVSLDGYFHLWKAENNLCKVKQ